MRILLMIDGSNIFHAQRREGWQVDPGRLRQYVERWGDVIESRYYLSVWLDERSEGRDKFKKALVWMGYSIVSLPIKEIETTDGIIEKSNADVRMALDAYMALDTYDMLVMVSGDGDFAYLMEILKSRGKMIRVISTRAFVAKEIIELVGKDFYDLNEIRFDVERINGS
jgi:uncharacterized LabA/DUF88 family protein